MNFNVLALVAQEKHTEGFNCCGENCNRSNCKEEEETEEAKYYDDSRVHIIP
jgi:hypothetical protein